METIGHVSPEQQGTNTILVQTLRNLPVDVTRPEIVQLRDKSQYATAAEVNARLGMKADASYVSNILSEKATLEQLQAKRDEMVGTNEIIPTASGYNNIQGDVVMSSSVWGFYYNNDSDPNYTSPTGSEVPIVESSGGDIVVYRGTADLALYPNTDLGSFADLYTLAHWGKPYIDTLSELTLTHNTTNPVRIPFGTPLNWSYLEGSFGLQDTERLLLNTGTTTLRCAISLKLHVRSLTSAMTVSLIRYPGPYDPNTITKNELDALSCQSYHYSTPTTTPTEIHDTLTSVLELMPGQGFYFYLTKQGTESIGIGSSLSRGARNYERHTRLQVYGI